MKLADNRRISHHDALTRLAEVRAQTDVVVATMTAGTFWPAISKHAMDICHHAPMGAASPLGLGISIARPDLGVVVLDSDGSILMNLGALVTIGGRKPKKFLHIVFENGVYDMTGKQALPGTGTSSLPTIAKAAGYERALRTADLAEIGQAVVDMHEGAGPIFLAVPVTGDFDMSKIGSIGRSPETMQRVGAAGFANLRREIQSRP